MLSTALLLASLVQPQSVDLVGTVRDSAGAAVPAAQVHVIGGSRQIRVGSDGTFRLSLTVGTHDLVVSAEGFAPSRRRVTVTPPRAESHFTLTRSAVSLSAITVTAAPGGRAISDAGTTVSALQGRDLERALSGTLAATLGQQAGVHVRSQGPSAAMPVIRGLTGDRIVVLQDGQRAGDLAGSAPDHGVTIDPLAARRIEVVRGPATLLHGSNATGGVVNVVSGEGAGSIPEQAVSSVALSLESVASGAAGWVEHQQPLGERLALNLRGGSRSSGNQRLGSGDQLLANTSAQSRTIDLALHAAGARTQGVVQWRRYGFEYGLPFRDAPDGAVRLDGARHELSTRWQHRPSGLVRRLEVDGTYQRYSHDENLPNGVAATRLSLASQQLRAMAFAGERDEMVVGLTLQRREQGQGGSGALLPPNLQRGVAAFGFREFAPREGLRVPLSARIERGTMTSASTGLFGAGVERRFDIWSASAGVVAHTSARSTLTINGSRAARLPSPEELFSRAGHAGTGAFEIGNTLLVPEVTRAVDAGWRYERPDLRVQVATFHTAVAGWIGLYPSGRDTVVESGGVTKRLPLHTVAQRAARMSGLELDAERRVGSSLVFGVVADALRAQDADGAPLPYMPAARLGGSVRYEHRRWHMGVQLRHVFGQGDVPVGEYATDAVALADAWAGLRWTTARTVQSVLLRLDNATDRLWRDATSRAKDYAPNPGRGASLVWRTSF